MDKVRAGVNWRVALVAVEVLVAVGCAFAGWRLVAGPHPNTGVEVHRGAAGPAEEAPGYLGLPLAPGAPAKPAQGLPGVTPLTDLLNRLNQEDLRLYSSQWQVIQILVDGTRRYLELKVLPAVKAA